MEMDDPHQICYPRDPAHRTFVLVSQKVKLLVLIAGFPIQHWWPLCLTIQTVWHIVSLSFHVSFHISSLNLLFSIVIWLELFHPKTISSPGVLPWYSFNKPTSLVKWLFYSLCRKPVDASSSNILFKALQFCHQRNPLRHYPISAVNAPSTCSNEALWRAMHISPPPQDFLESLMESFRAHDQR